MNSVRASACAPSIYLASQSPRRRELLHQIGVPHAVVRADVIEVPRHQESPADYVQRLAQEKSLAGMATMIVQDLPIKPVLGADTIVVSGGDILEKPRDAEHAAVMLKKLSGRTHQVITAVALATQHKVDVKLSVTDVTFRLLTNEEISAYWSTGEPQDKAGGYAIQGLGAVFVQQLHGSFSNVVGLPIEQVVELLAIAKISWWQS